MIGIEYFIKLCQMDVKTLNQEVGINEDHLSFDDLCSGADLNIISEIIKNMTGIEKTKLLKEIDQVDRIEILLTLLKREIKQRPIFDGYSSQLSIFGSNITCKGEGSLQELLEKRDGMLHERIEEDFDELDLEDKKPIIYELYRSIIEEDDEFELE